MRRLLLVFLALAAGCGDPDPATAPVTPRQYAPSLAKVSVDSASQRFAPQGYEVKEFRAVHRMTWTFTRKPTPEVILSFGLDGSAPDKIEDVCASCLYFDKKNHDPEAMNLFVQVLREAYKGRQFEEIKSWLRENFNRPTVTRYTDGLEFSIQSAPTFRQLRIRHDPRRPAQSTARLEWAPPTNHPARRQPVRVEQPTL